MEKIPSRKNLVDQTVDILRERMASGEWEEFLPPELTLSKQLQIGRNTLRKALVELTAEGLIEKGHAGRRRRIRRRTRRGRSRRGKTHPIILLTPYSHEGLPALELKLVEEMRPLLADSGYRLDLEPTKAFRLQRPGAALEQLVRAHRASAWVLHQTTQPMQQWFERKRVPCAILGAPHEGIRIPSVTQDILAAARHATGLLRSRGHKHITLLTFRRGLAGSQLVFRGFAEALDATGRNDIDAESRLVELHTDLKRTCAKLDQALRAPNPPTAFVVEVAQMVPTLMTYLGQQGLRIPRDISVISLFDTPSLDFLVPEVARYHVNMHRQVQRLVRCVVRAAKHGPFSADSVRIMPELRAGRSVARPRRRQT